MRAAALSCQQCSTSYAHVVEPVPLRSSVRARPALAVWPAGICMQQGRSASCATTCSAAAHGADAPRGADYCNEDDDDDDGDDGNSPLSKKLLKALAQQPGVRVVVERAEEDEDDWDDILEELGNPWNMEPGKVDPVEDLGLPPLMTPPISSVLGGQAPSDAAAAAEAVTVLDEAGFRQLLLSDDVQGALVLLDVREDEECAASPLSLATRHQPLSKIDAAFAGVLRGGGTGGDSSGGGSSLSASTVVVLGSGDHRGLQAATRLAKVYKLPRVHLYEGVGAVPYKH